MAQGYTTLASLGQKYKDYPGELDRERPPQDIIRELYQQELLRQHIDRQRLPPETITPGSRSWPYGYIRTENDRPTLMQLAGDVVQGNFPVSGPRVRLPDGRIVPLNIFGQPGAADDTAYAPGRGRDPYLSIVPKQPQR